MSRILFPLLIVVALFVSLIWMGNLGWGPVVINREGEERVILRLGNPVKVIPEPGWALRVPLLDEVKVYDGRFQFLDAQAVEMLIARGEKLIIDYYVVWRIRDPLAFLKSFPEGMEKANDRIQETVNALVGAKVGGLTLTEILARAEILDRLAEESNTDLEDTGVVVADVRLARTELPRAAEPAAYQQMREQRRALSREYRVQGEREARIIRAEAERDARTAIAAANATSEITRGEGDAEAAAIYAEAYNRDPDFYAFVRSLEAYRKSLGDGTTMVLPPDHEFFRFLSPDAAMGAAKRPGQ
ncbi:MAG: protease modulator HflC [Myxococcota bacterium]